MPSFTITPQSVLLTAGQAVTFHFHATGPDSDHKPVLANWSLNPPVVPGLTAPTTGVSSVTFVAPQTVATQTLAVIASTVPDPADSQNLYSANASISLTPDAITIVPAKVELRSGEQQKFLAIVPEAPPASEGEPTAIRWILNPDRGKLSVSDKDKRECEYTAPPEIPDSTTVNVIASSQAGKQGSAAVTLASPPWQGVGVQFLGTYLLLVFSLVLFMMEFWPTSLPTPEVAKADRIEAESNLETKRDKLRTAQQQASDSAKNNPRVEGSSAASKEGEGNAQSGSAKARQGQKPPLSTNAQTNTLAENKGDAACSACADTAYANGEVRDRQQDVEQAYADLESKRAAEKEVNKPEVRTRVGYINRELDLLLLVLLGGTLGAFLHVAQSYSDYVGNRTLKRSWAWWYSLRPFIGAGLALVFYTAVRGGFMAITSGSNAKAAELNPFGVVSIAAVVGMFSKAATMKLGELFDTLFQTAKAEESKDKLTTKPTQKPGTSGTGSGTATGQAH
jgi:hypothetical protein